MGVEIFLKKFGGRVKKPRVRDCTSSRSEFNETGVVSHETGSLQMSEERRVLKQVSSDAVTAALVVQFVSEHVVPHYRLRKLGELF